MSDAELRLRSIAEGRLRAGPETLQLNLTNRCNLACIFCWNHSPLVAPRPAAWHAQRLSDAHLDNVLGSLEALHPGQVLLSGRGEPLLHPRVEQLLSRLRALEIAVTVQTNGLGGPTPERIAELGVARVLLNLSAATEEAYARTHPGHGAAFARVLTRLERLERQPRSPRLTVLAVIQRNNATETPALVELAARLGAERLYLKGLELIAGTEALEPLRLDGQDAERARRALDQARARAETLGLPLDATHLAAVLGARGEPRRAGGFSPDLAGGPCYMGWYYLRVTCDGRVMFCCKDKQVGHLDDTSLYRVWRAPTYQLLRLAGRDGDRTAGLFDAKCRACSNFARNRQLTALQGG